MAVHENPCLHVPIISDKITSKRFKTITENLNLNDNTQVKPRGESGFNKLFKLRPFIDTLNQNCRKFFNLSKVLSIDEAMIAIKGHNSMKQNMPNKLVKRGYKVWYLISHMLNLDIS